MSSPPSRVPGAPRVRVWDRAVRVLHWGLVASVGLSTLGVLAPPGALSSWHRPSGYVALAIVVLRVLWSRVGGGHARLASFVRGPRATARYLRLVLRHREPRHLGHNPLGGWMVVALLACVSALGATGWLYTTDAFFGDETFEALHLALAWTLLALVVAHVSGVIFTSVRQRENLVAAMFTGTKRAPRGGDID